MEVNCVSITFLLAFEWGGKLLKGLEVAEKRTEGGELEIRNWKIVVENRGDGGETYTTFLRNGVCFAHGQNKH
jgi:hypothetical protein